MSKIKGFGALADAFQKHEASFKVDAVGNGKYGMDHNTLAPVGVKKVQSPAQHMAVKKAAAVSVRNRKLRAGMTGF